MCFAFVFMTMYMHKIMILKQYSILQNYIRLTKMDYFLILAEYINNIGYFAYDMQIMRRGNYCFPGKILFQQQINDMSCRQWVQTGRGLIQNDNIRIYNECGSYGDFSFFTNA